MAAQEKGRLNRIKSSAFSRGFALARVSVSAGARAASHAMGNLFADEGDKPERLKDLLMSQISALTQELGQLKGSLMKVGQMLSMYGEHFLPAEANALLKSLQSQSPPLEWAAIKKAIDRQLSPEILATVEIDPEPMASASLGQVHRVKRKSDGRLLAMKIQYPGVDQAIEGDLKALKSILSVSKLIPKGPRYDDLFKEIRTMLHHEVDYARELEITREFREHLSDDSRYVLPEVIPELSTKRILTTTFEEGVSLDSPEVMKLSQERRNAIGIAALELYFREIFEIGAVQTDPHMGNYRVRLAKSGPEDGSQGESKSESKDQLILLDFGAVRKFSKTFLVSYLKVVRGAHARNRQLLVEGATELDFLRDGDSIEMQNIFVELCYLINEPFFTRETPGVRADLFNPDGSYRWGDSDLPTRVAKKGTQFVAAFKLRPPPREIVFLDRKLGGTFILLYMLKVQIRSSESILPFLKKYENLNSDSASNSPSNSVSKGPVS